MASVRERDGRLFFDFRFNGQRCRELTALTDTPSNRKRMDAVAKRLEVDISAGTFEYEQYFPNSRGAKRLGKTNSGSSLPDHQIVGHCADQPSDALPKFSELAAQWQRDRGVEWRDSYKAIVANVVDVHLLPVFGNVGIDAIDRAAVLEFRSRIAEPRETAGVIRRRAPATINRIMSILRMIMDEAALRHDVPNPCTAVRRLKLQKTDIQPFSMEEVQLLTATVRPDYRDYLVVRFFTGMRSGEVNGLKWRHVDFDRGEIRIRETFAKGKTEYTKTDGSQREIRMNPPVLAALRRMQPVTQPLGEYVFCNREGQPLDNHNFVNRVWRPLLRHLGFELRRPYQMRHTCATLWLAAGENPEWVARQLGHTTTRMLFSVYSRFVPNLTRNDGAAFDRLISGAFSNAQQP